MQLLIACMKLLHCCMHATTVVCMSKDNDWWGFVTRLLDGDTPADAERKSGINRSNFTRWKQGREVDPVMAVALTRKYNGNILAALVACGLITSEEAKLREVGLEEALEKATDRQLVVAVLRKIDGRDAGTVTELDMPLNAGHPGVIEAWGPDAKPFNLNDKKAAKKGDAGQQTPADNA